MQDWAWITSSGLRMQPILLDKGIMGAVAGLTSQEDQMWPP